MMRPFRSPLPITHLLVPALVALCFQTTAPRAALAQGVTQDEDLVWPILMVDGPAVDRLRTDQLVGDAPTAGTLIRSTSSITERLQPDTARVRFSIIPPQIEGIFNSKIPSLSNDGGLWAGRGNNLSMTLGTRIAVGPFQLTVAPERDYSENRNFKEFFLWNEFRVDPLRNPWQTGALSTDLPRRMGEKSLREWHLGQSAVSLNLGAVEAGVSSENLWWGPGIRNSIVMGSAAAGFAHSYLRTARPLHTRVGDFEASWVNGLLHESRVYDGESNGTRSLSAIAATLRLASAPGLTLGVARAVYERDGSSIFDPGRSTQAFTRWRDYGPDAADSSEVDSEQILSLFGRWVFPESGLEAYAEWARAELPSSLRDFMLAPQRSQGYTVGLQWARPAFGPGLVRLQTEATYLENSGKVGPETVRGFYVGERVPQGYTHLGQSIGAAIGPGSSSQWLAVDYLAPGWRLGGFVERVRHNADAFPVTYAWPLNTMSRDVSIVLGLRTGLRIDGLADLELEYGVDNRMNYLFQNWSPNIDDLQALDVRNTSLRFSVSPIRALR